MKPVVLVHGAWHGAWCWDYVTPLLDAAGVPWVAPDLPSCARARERAGVIEDVQTVEAALDALPGGEEAILLGHSRGGIVISEAGAHRRVGSLIYLTAFLLEAGETFGPAAGELRAPLGNDRFYNDCPDEQVAWAAKQLRPTFMGGAPFTPSRLAWAQKPTTYVVCTLDAAIPVADQRTMALRAGRSVEWETGHSPFLNRPDLVAELLVALAE